MMGREVKGVRMIWSGFLMMGLLEFCWVVVEVVTVLVLLGPCGEEEEEEEEIWRRWSISESNGGEGGG